MYVPASENNEPSFPSTVQMYELLEIASARKSAVVPYVISLVVVLYAITFAAEDVSWRIPSVNKPSSFNVNSC